MFGFKIIRAAEYDRMVAEIYQRQASMMGSQHREDTLRAERDKAIEERDEARNLARIGQAAVEQNSDLGVAVAALTKERDEAQGLLRTRTRQLDDAREETGILRKQWTGMQEERATAVAERGAAQESEAYHREQVGAYITSVTGLREQLDAALAERNAAQEQAKRDVHDAVTARNHAEARVTELERDLAKANRAIAKAAPRTSPAKPRKATPPVDAPIRATKGGK